MSAWMLWAALAGGVAVIAWVFTSAMRGLVREEGQIGVEIQGACGSRLSRMSEREREQLEATFEAWRMKSKPDMTTKRCERKECEDVIAIGSRS